MKRLLQIAALLVVALSFVACGPQAALKVAILAPLSGPVPTFGVSTRDGALLAIEEWNAKGGVLKREDRAHRRGQPVHPRPRRQRGEQGHRSGQGEVHRRRGLLLRLDPDLRDRQREEGHPDQPDLDQHRW